MLSIFIKQVGSKLAGSSDSGAAILTRDGIASLRASLLIARLVEEHAYNLSRSLTR